MLKFQVSNEKRVEVLAGKWNKKKERNNGVSLLEQCLCLPHGSHKLREYGGFYSIDSVINVHYIIICVGLSGSRRLPKYSLFVYLQVIYTINVDDYLFCSFSSLKYCNLLRCVNCVTVLVLDRSSMRVCAN